MRAMSLLVMLFSFVPVQQVAQAAPALPPIDMFQLPWEQGKAWVALDGFDNGSKRSTTSPHNYLNGGAVDFAPHNNMIPGENTSSFWVTAVADGTIVETSKCHLKIAHANGWVSEYQHLANFQVKLGDVVTQNQKLAVIANATTQPVCAGSDPPDIPHLHFALRPNMVGATFAGWKFNYSSFWNSTSFTKNGVTVGLFKPLLNVLDSGSTATPTVIATSTSGGQPTETPVFTITSTPPPVTATSTPPTGPYVSTSVDQANIQVGATALVTVDLHNVPAEGYNSAEFTCTYNMLYIQTNNITITDLFGADAATAINDSQNGVFIVAIAGSNGNKATTSGTVFTFIAQGVDAGETALECTARVSQGNSSLTDLPSIGTGLAVLGLTPTPTDTPSPTPPTPTVSPSVCDRAEFIADITVPSGTTFSPGEQFTKTWRLMNIGTCDWTTSYRLAFFSGEKMNAPSFVNFSANVLSGETVDISVNLIAPSTAGSYSGYWILQNANGAFFGIGPQAKDPFSVNIEVSGIVQPTITPIPGWLTFTDVTYSFQFQYPPQGQIQADSNDSNTRINELPIVQPGTNLTHKFMDVLVGQNVTECKSDQVQDPGVNVTINGIPFLKQTGAQGAAGSLFTLVEYSTLRDGVCVNLEFVLQSHDPSSFPTPPPVFDYATESALFDQIVQTYMWLALPPTATFTPMPAESATPSFTPTPFDSPTPDTSPTAATPTMTPTGSPTGMIVGKAIASKPVTISVYDSNNALIVSVPVSQDGSFAVTLSGGTYTVVASASGYLSTQGSFSVTSNLNSTLPTITLSAGDIDNNNAIDQFDAMTIGMSYNTDVPSAADLNNDGIINVLDLELLAKNYRMTGPVVWP